MKNNITVNTANHHQVEEKRHHYLCLPCYARLPYSLRGNCYVFVFFNGLLFHFLFSWTSRNGIVPCILLMIFFYSVLCSWDSPTLLHTIIIIYLATVWYSIAFILLLMNMWGVLFPAIKKSAFRTIVNIDGTTVRRMDRSFSIIYAPRSKHVFNFTG